MKAVLLAASLIQLLPPLAADPQREVAPARDDRFFGTWCLPAPKPVCRKVKVKVGWGPLSFTVRERTECAQLEEARVHVDYYESVAGGQVRGSGFYRVDGRLRPLAAGGPVTAPGRAWMAVSAPPLGRNEGWLRLVQGGQALRLASHGEVLTLRKDACGNRAPQVSVASDDGAQLAWGELHCFEGRIDEDEDASFPEHRMSLASDRDGELQALPWTHVGLTAAGLADHASLASAGTSGSASASPSPAPPPAQRKLRRCTSRLSPGPHAIRFAATDSGGLQGVAEIAVTVSNRPPRAPWIVQPRGDDTIVATGPLIFEGKALDPEQGLLDTGLEWSASREGGPFAALGAGRRLLAAFPEPGAWVLRLTARDAAGATSASEHEVTVLPFRDNTPPRVTIEVPRHLDEPSPLGGSFAPGEVIFRGTVADAEDADGDLSLRWDAERIQPPGPPLAPVLDSTLAIFDLALSAGGQRQLYEVTFRATDRGGLEGKKVIRVVVWPQP